MGLTPKSVCRSSQFRASRIGKAEEEGRFIKGFARRIIKSSLQQLIPTDPPYHMKFGVPA
jgi:hypothetical protein